MSFLDYNGLSKFLNKLKTIFILNSSRGVANGLAELDSNGKVLSSQLPSYVDDVLEYSNYNQFPLTGENGKIYVDLEDNKTYRWSGSQYIEISPSLTLGNTSSTAYRGDHGSIAYDHATDSNRLTTSVTSGLYKVSVSSEGHISGTTAVTKNDITALGIPSTNTTYESKSAVQNGTDESLVTTGEKYIWNTKAPTNNPVFTSSISLGRKENTTVGSGSLAVGLDNTASSSYAVAFGESAEAIAKHSFAQGLGVIASGNNQHAIGKYNVSDTTSLELVGNGSADGTRSNARKLDVNGNEYLKGDLYIGCNANSSGGTKVLKRGVTWGDLKGT